MSEKLDFHTINDQLLNMGAINSPAQLQGLLCGKVCGGQTLDKTQWHETAIEFLDVDHIQLDDEQLALLDQLLEFTVAQMDDLNFSFNPLLPDDNATLQRRTQELGGWCEAFLHGVGTSGLQLEDKLSADVADALRDMAKISQVNIDEEEVDDENEVYWNELVEYVKVAVLNVYAELSQKTPARSASKTVH